MSKFYFRIDMALPQELSRKYFWKLFQNSNEMGKCVSGVSSFLTCLVEVKQTEYFKIFSNKRHTTNKKNTEQTLCDQTCNREGRLGGPLVIN